MLVIYIILPFIKENLLFLKMFTPVKVVRRVEQIVRAAV